MDERKFLQRIKEGELSIEEGIDYIKKLPYEDLGMAKLDHHRKVRRGTGEVIYCQGKEVEDLLRIFQAFSNRKVNILGTRANKEQYEFLKKEFQGLEFDEKSSVIQLEIETIEKKGCVVIATGGTTDIPRAQEAALTAEFFGAKVERLYDVGVAGIHRLLENRKLLDSANVIVAVAGMEGALASVIGGLVSVPVIALPTSIGYGASFNGLAALLSMLNSCSEGVTVVNIDNGFGAGYSAAQINRLALGKNF